MTDSRSSSALFTRAEQLKRWEDSDTNKQSALPKRASRIQFSSGIVFLAACTAGDKEEVQRLLKMGADINTANVDGLTALHQACIDDNLDMVEFLVTHGADVNRGDNEGWTALHATASCGFLSIARYLLENGADVGAVNYDGELAIDIAESDAMEELLQKAIDEKGVDCEKSRNAEVDTLVADARHWAATGYVEVRDPKTGGTPLHVAAAKGYLDVAKTLLEECSVEPECVDYEGWTPLHAAALWGQKEACALLLQHGADPHLTNYSGQTCMDLVDPTISGWLAEAAAKASPRRVNNNNNKRRRSPPAAPHHVPHHVPHQPPHHPPHMKRVELQITPQDAVINEKGAELPKPGEKPPKGRAPSPGSGGAAGPDGAPDGDDAPSWRRSASFRRQEPPRENNKPANNTTAADHDTILRRTHSFENDKTFYQRYRDVTARIKASSCPSIPPPPPAAPAGPPAAVTAVTAVTAATDRMVAERREREANNSWSAATATATATGPTHTTSQTTVRRSFVPPVRDEESETQRKAHAKRVRETRRSTQGVTLDEIKSAEQLVKRKTGNGTSEPAAPPAPSSPPAPPAPAPPAPAAPPAPPAPPDDAAHSANANSAHGAEGAEGRGATVCATIAASAERRPSWRLRLDPANKFELEDASRAAPATGGADTTVTMPLRRPPVAAAPVAATPAPLHDARTADDERESSAESKSSSASPASAQPALNVVQRRRRPKRRSTGVGRVDMDDIVNDRGSGGGGGGAGGAGGGGGGEADTETPSPQSGSDRGREEDEEGARDYKALYEASQAEVRRLRALLQTSEQQLRDVRATIACLTQNQSQNSMRLFERASQQSSVSELEKREKRAMERKLSEMEEELKYQQALQAENQRLKDENGALIRVISKLSK